MHHLLRLGVAAIIATAATMASAATPAEKCEAAKKAEAGKFTACRMKAEAKLVTTGDMGTYNTAIAKCTSKLQSKYAKLEDGGSCPTVGDATTVIDFLAVCTDGVSESASGGSALPTCGDGIVNIAGEECDGSNFGVRTCASFGFASGTLACASTCKLDTSACVAGGGASDCGNGTINVGEDCDQGDLNGGTCTGEGFAGGTLSCGGGCVYNTSGCFVDRYVDNGDGTITDKQTRLMWEKRVKFDSSQDPANLHDADNTYRFSGSCSSDSALCQPNAAAAAACAAGVEGNPLGCAVCASGTCENASVTNKTVWEFLLDLNASTFAGYADWRIPTLAESYTLINRQYSEPAMAPAFNGASCGTACADISNPACSCPYGNVNELQTATTGATTNQAYSIATDWVGFFNDASKVTSLEVRAVRDVD